MSQLTALPVTTKKISDPTSQVPVANGISVSKTTDGPVTVLPAVTHDRLVMAVVAEATEDFVDGSGAQTVVSIGDDDSAERMIAAVEISGSTTGDIHKAGPLTSTPFGGTGSCILLAGKSLIATVTPATGTGTGACKIVAVTVAAP